MSRRKPHSTVSAIREHAALVAAIFTLPYANCEQAAIVEDIHPATVRRQCADGVLPHVHVGTGQKLMRIATDDLRTFLSGGASANAVPCAICRAHRRGPRKRSKRAA